jgi:hypothetical protein
MSHLLVLEFDLPFDILGSDDQTVLDWYNKIFNGSDQRFRVYKAIWAARYQTEQFEDLPAFLALVSSFPEQCWSPPFNTQCQHEFMDDKDVPHEITRVIQCGVKVNQWRLHASFETSSGAPRFFNLTRKY